MLNIFGSIKRFIVGKPYRTDFMQETLLPKRIAMPVYGGDALSSVGYAPDEIVLTLSLAAAAGLFFSPMVAAAVVFVLIAVVASYRQNVYAYPNGGGGYEIVKDNLGARASLVVGAALIVDYVLAVAVSMSQATAFLVAAVEPLHGWQTPITVGLILMLMVLNLRGLKESGWLFAAPNYVFIGSVFLMLALGFYQWFTGSLNPAESANYEVVPLPEFEQGIIGFAGMFLILRAFASGASALTGVECISNGVPTFKEPKSKNASTSLLILGLIAGSMMIGILALAQATKVHLVEHPDTQLRINGQMAPEGLLQHPVLSQLAAAICNSNSVLYYIIVVSSGLILLLACNTAFNGLPGLASALARDGFLPRQLRNRGDRLTYSNSIILLSAAAIALVIIFDSSVTALIQLFIVGVFVSFSLSQFGMVKYWGRMLLEVTSSKERRKMRTAQLINVVGGIMTTLVFFIVLITKFVHGVWLAMLAMLILYLFMWSLHTHYDNVRKELAIEEGSIPKEERMDSVHAIVLAGRVRKHTIRALAYAEATHPQYMEAVTVDVDSEETAKVQADWKKWSLDTPLHIIESPYRFTIKPLIDYILELQAKDPDTLIAVYIPEYVVGHWWEQIVHNQTALRIKSRLHFVHGVSVVSVPWQLASSQKRTDVLTAPLDVPKS